MNFAAKKALSILLIAMLLSAVFSACGNGSAPADTAAPDYGDYAAVELDGPATTLTVWFLGGDASNDDTLVVEAANARLRELGLNINLNPIWTGGWAMGEPAQIALDTGDSSIDIFWTGSWGLNFWHNARHGNFVRLDDPENNLLERYGRDMMAAVPQPLWDAFTTDGPLGFGVYGIPGYKDYAAMATLDSNYDLITELGFDFYELFDMDGVNYGVFFDPMFEEILQAAKDTWGDDYFPLAPEPGNWVRHFANSEADVTGLGVFHLPMDPRNPALPENPEFVLILEDELSLRVIERLHYFWNKGYIDPRLAIPGEFDIGEAMRTGSALFTSRQYAYGYTAIASENRGMQALFPRLSRSVISSVSAAGSGFAISVYSQKQEAAMQFMNAWYTDNELAVILAEGIEGVHWNYTDDGLIELDPYGRATYSTWRFGMGNIFVLTPRNTDGHGYFERFQAYNEEGIPHALLGFTFNTEPVAMEMAALSAVVAEFNHTVTIGAVDPATAVPAYLDALRANGVDRVLEELNNQAREFLAARN